MTVLPAPKLRHGGAEAPGADHIPVVIYRHTVKLHQTAPAAPVKIQGNPAVRFHLLGIRNILGRSRHVTERKQDTVRKSLSAGQAVLPPFLCRTGCQCPADSLSKGNLRPPSCLVLDPADIRNQVCRPFGIWRKAPVAGGSHAAAEDMHLLHVIPQRSGGRTFRCHIINLFFPFSRIKEQAHQGLNQIVHVKKIPELGTGPQFHNSVSAEGIKAGIHKRPGMVPRPVHTKNPGMDVLHPCQTVILLFYIFPRPDSEFQLRLAVFGYRVTYVILPHDIPALAVFCLGAAEKETAASEFLCAFQRFHGILHILLLYFCILPVLTSGTVPSKMQEAVAGLRNLLFNPVKLGELCLQHNQTLLLFWQRLSV